MCLFTSSSSRKEILQTTDTHTHTHTHTHISASSFPSTQPFVWKTRLKDERQTIDPCALSRLKRSCPARAYIGFRRYKSGAAKRLHSMCHQSCPKHRVAARSEHRSMKYSAWQRRHNPARSSNTSQQKCVHVHHQQMAQAHWGRPCWDEEPLVLSALVLLSSNVVGWQF